MFDRVKRFFYSEPPLAYEIVQCETKVLESPTGPKFVILLAANLRHIDALDVLLEALVEHFKVHRMISPPDTSMLLITIIGPGQATEITSRWRARVAGDQIASFWMGQMEKADLGVSPATGSIPPAYHSLLPNVG